VFDAAPENERDGPNQAEAQAQKVRQVEDARIILAPNLGLSSQ